MVASTTGMCRVSMTVMPRGSRALHPELRGAYTRAKIDHQIERVGHPVATSTRPMTRTLVAIAFAWRWWRDLARSDGPTHDGVSRTGPHRFEVACVVHRAGASEVAALVFPVLGEGVGLDPTRPTLGGVGEHPVQ
jgi:hypothetical protein